LTPNHKLLKLTVEGSLKENSKDKKISTELDRPVDKKLTINSNLLRYRIGWIVHFKQYE
jgi:hypothetical protein